MEVSSVSGYYIAVVAPVASIPRPQNTRKEVWRVKRVTLRYVTILYIVYCQVILTIYATRLAPQKNYGPDNISTKGNTD